MSLEEKSKIFANCIKDLYKKGIYTIEYAILKLEEYKDNGKIIASDYEEYLAFFASEKEKQDAVVEAVEEAVETSEASAEETEQEIIAENQNIEEDA